MRGTPERGGGSANAMALLVTSDDGAFGDGGEGGFVDMVTICILFIYFWSCVALVFGRRAGKIRKRAKL